MYARAVANCTEHFRPRPARHLYRHEITDGPAVAREAEAYRQAFNHIRPHEALGVARPAERYLAALHDRPEPVSVLNQSEPENLPLS